MSCGDAESAREHYESGALAVLRGRPGLPVGGALDDGRWGHEAPLGTESTETLLDYGAVALAFDEGNKGHDVSQNLEALLSSLATPAGAPRALDVLDLGCAGGRDLLALAARGHRPVGLDGAPEFVALARAKGPFEVWEQDLCRLALPAARFDGVFANAVLFHVPSAHLDAALAQIWATLRPGGAFFCSNAHGFGEDKEDFAVFSVVLYFQELYVFQLKFTNWKGFNLKVSACLSQWHCGTWGVLLTGILTYLLTHLLPGCLTY